MAEQMKMYGQLSGHVDLHILTSLSGNVPAILRRIYETCIAWDNTGSGRRGERAESELLQPLAVNTSG